MTQEHRPVWPVFVTFLLATVAVMVAGMVVLLARFGLGGAGHPPLDALTLDLSALVTEVVLVAAALLFGRPFTPARFGLVSGRARSLDVLLVAAGTVALADVVDSLVTLAGFSNSGSIAAMRQAIEGAAGWGLVATVSIIGPVAGFAEELFFRGFMQTRLSERWGPWRAVLWASFCFGFLHFDLIHSTEAFLIGLWLGHATERTGSLWPAVVGHVTNNVLSVLFQRLGLVTAKVLPNLLWGAAGLVVLVTVAVALRARPVSPPAIVPLSAA
jgi:membrane protease YdiL (CAAX protease family)